MESKPRLWVIDPSLYHAEDQGVAEILRVWNGASRLFRPALAPGDGPGPGTDYATDVVVLLGSAASVYDNHPWIPALASWVRPMLRGEQRIPLLGVCFGHQLIAHLSGGRVDYVNEHHSKIVGVERTYLAGSRLLPGEHDLSVVVSHREEVKQAPTEYRVTAWRDNAPIDGLEHRTLPIFTFQFHPEAREEFARRAGIPTADIDERLRRDSAKVLTAFLEWARVATAWR